MSVGNESLAKAMKNLKLDSRLTEQNLRSGQITKEELKKHLESLPDCAAMSEPLNLERKERAEQH